MAAPVVLVGLGVLVLVGLGEFVLVNVDVPDAGVGVLVYVPVLLGVGVLELVGETVHVLVIVGVYVAVPPQEVENENH